MLFGTDLKFRLAYFFTAFFPAFLLIYFSLVDIHHFLLKETESLPCYLSRNLWHFLMLSVLLSIMLISIYSIRGYINGRRSEENIVKNIYVRFFLYDMLCALVFTERAYVTNVIYYFFRRISNLNRDASDCYPYWISG